MDSKEMISEAKLELENIDMVIDVKLVLCQDLVQVKMRFSSS